MHDPTLRISVAQKLQGLILARCPRCTQGAIYATSSDMHERCPVCGLLYKREDGYFLGALYISYGLATAIMLLFLYLGHLLLPEWDLGTIVLIVGVCFLPLAPAVTRYARVLWIYFDRWAWPAPPGSAD